MKQLILASASPRRKELLSSLGVPFQTLPVDIEERAYPGELPHLYVARLAVEKAAAGLARAVTHQQETWVLGSDTIVVHQQKILEKPKHKQDFEQMMASLSGASHEVMTAICLLSETQQFTETLITKVNFRVLSASDIDHYWQTGEPADKAGGYGIQGIAARFVQSIKGSYSSVVGLPLCETEHFLKRAGFQTAM